MTTTSPHIWENKHLKWPKKDDSLKDYVKWFQYNLWRSKHSKLDKQTLWIILLKRISDGCIDILNSIGDGDVSHLTYQEIYDANNGNFPRYITTQLIKLSRREHSSWDWKTIREIQKWYPHLFKLTIRYIVNWEEAELSLSIFRSKCRMKHPSMDCPLNNIEICEVYE